MTFKNDLIIELLIHALSETRAHNEIAAIMYFNKNLKETELINLFSELRKQKEDELRAEIISKYQMNNINDVLDNIE